ncbi:MAG: hypothetical protein C0624_00975 [Desulfuromonas sp.]|nr:MAG: hypothetical protein C0624_00975 [Desulfuromonas sp.]
MSTEPQGARRRLNPWSWLINHLKNKLMAGLLVIIPIGITLFILRFMFDMADGVLAPWLRQGASRVLGEEIYVPGLGMVTGLMVLYLTGLLVSNVFGKAIMTGLDSLSLRIPVVKSVYSFSKQVMQIFSRSGQESFRRAVYIEFPLAGTFSIAFVTNTVYAESGKKYYTCFIPTSPNPTGGYVLILPEERVFSTTFGVEEAMKIIMSGGVVAPDKIRADCMQ